MISVHVNHEKELAPEVSQALELLADGGIPLGSQSVLLKGINDSAETMMSLSHELLKIRVRPYYIYQCDPVFGTEHFRTSVDIGIKIIEKMRGFTTGYAIPTFVVDAPGGGGKIPLSPNYLMSKIQGKTILRNYENHIFEYHDPIEVSAKKRRKKPDEKSSLQMSLPHVTDSGKVTDKSFSGKIKVTAS